jgi:peptidyl-dipeptidase A
MIKPLISLAALSMALAAPAFAADAAPAAPPTTADADKFITKAEAELQDFAPFAARAAWVNETYITDDTDALNARIGAMGTEMGVRMAKQAAQFQGVAGLSFDTKRKLDLLRGGLTLAAPDTPGAAAELNTLSTRMGSLYGKGKGTYEGKPTSGNDLEALMETVRDPAKLSEMWTSWHKVGAPMRADFTRLVDISNQGARALGYADTGAMWRSGYDMPPEQFSAMLDKLWAQVKPLYAELHCYTRTKLNEKYGDAVQPKTGPIRADLLGNMWAQDWSGIYDIVAPSGAGGAGYDIGELLKAKNFDAIAMFRQGESFYKSLGFAPLPQTFWERSQITRPRDREVVCHASAWDLDGVDDLRIKMCTKVNGTDFVTIHHEMGHNFYQRAYNTQSQLYREGANDGFHEAIGDFIALSVTPDYLVKTGLLDASKVPPPSGDLGLLLHQALEKVPGLPWTLLVDKYRWDVFAGKITSDKLNQGWTDVRLKYMGIVPPVARSENDFDPGAKYHIAASVPYARYFLARVLQFQFYQSACKAAGWPTDGSQPLHRCDFYGNKAVGAKLNTMLSMGHSRPWPEALAAFTGTREIDGGALLAYFKPLMVWLQAQNKGKPCGW